MTSHPADSPRLLCRLVRWWSVFFPASSSTAANAGHRSRCPACRAHFASHDSLEQRLSHDAVRASPVEPVGLEQRIITAVRRGAPPVSAPPRRAFPGWAVGPLAATAATALVFVWIQRAPAPDRGAPAAPAEAAQVVAALEAIPRQYREVVVPSATRLLESDPLRRELNNMQADARSALAFLAANFLPATPAPVADRAATQGS